MGCLYRLTSPSGKSYIGITTKTAEKRFELHVKHSKDGRKNAIHNAINKYGPSAIKIETLLIADDFQYLRLMEVRAIKAFKTTAPNGYNLSMGGEDCDFWHPEVIKKMQKAQKQSWIDNRERKILASAPCIAAMTASRQNPLIETPRRQKISLTMKSSGIAVGEKNNQSKLTEQCVLRIKDMIRCKVKKTLIAKYFNVSYKLIWFIGAGQRWGHLNYSEIK